MSLEPNILGRIDPQRTSEIIDSTAEKCGILSDGNHWLIEGLKFMKYADKYVEAHYFKRF